MPRINKKLVYALAISLLLLILLLYVQNSRKKAGQWDETFEKNVSVTEAKSTQAEFRKCTASGSNECDNLLENSNKKLSDADFYYSGYEYCIKRFGKNAEDCKKLLESIQQNSEIQELRPSNKLERNGIE